MSDSPRKPFGHAKSSAPLPKPAPRAVPKVPPKPAFEVVEDEPADDGFEVIDEAPPPHKKARLAEPEPKKAKSAEPAPVVDDDEPERPKKKKKKKLDDLSKQLLRKQDEDDARRAESLKHFEFTVPIVMLVIGMALSVVGAFGAAKGVSGIYVFTVLCVFVATYVPLSIGALMVVGLLMGINYGRLGPGILKMAAITFLVNGIWLIGDWFKLPIFVIAPISGFISYGIFMTMFDLDTSETGASTGVLNIMTFVANIILIGFIVVAEASTSGSGSKTDTETEDEPRQERRERKRDRDRKPLDPSVPPGPIMPDDDDNDE